MHLYKKEVYKGKSSRVYGSGIKDTHREKEPSNKIPMLTKSTNMDICVVSTPNQLFITGS